MSGYGMMWHSEMSTCGKNLWFTRTPKLAINSKLRHIVSSPLSNVLSLYLNLCVTALGSSRSDNVWFLPYNNVLITHRFVESMAGDGSWREASSSKEECAVHDESDFVDTPVIDESDDTDPGYLLVDPDQTHESSAVLRGGEGHNGNADLTRPGPAARGEGRGPIPLSGAGGGDRAYGL
ncbi:unnamed protein product [Lactuca virosa]|uniref:Uncharacterized protein n=1 Tax=Lactuca virosa TaxID=75947 RepID=A0AAU9PGK0_9ASTR|nr:unnamed protein product [Lactuca virosa]